MAHNRFVSMFAPAAFGVGWMISPESFLLLGNAAGQLEYLVLAALVLAAFAHLAYYRTAGKDRPSPGNTTEFILETGALVSVAMSGGALILASAGYAFNENFVGRFPNLLFSFCILAIILAANLAGPKVSGMLQIALTAVVVVSLFVLLVMGLTGSPAGAAKGSIGQIESPAAWRYAFWLPVLFLGYDLAIGLKGDRSHRFHPAWAIPVMAILFILWALVSLKWVQPHRLSNLTIPHILTALAIGGDFGRMLIGLVVICGGAAAVNLLVLGTARKLTGWASRGFLPGFFGNMDKTTPVPLILVSLGIGAMMGFGMAGEPVTEVYMRGGLLMWLALLAYRSFTALRSPQKKSGSLWNLYSGLVFLASISIFVATYPNTSKLLTFTAIVVMALALWSVFRKVFQKPGGRISTGKGMNPAEPDCEKC